MSRYDEPGAYRAHGAGGAGAQLSSQSRPDGVPFTTAGGAGSRVLVVEDQEDVRRMLATALQIDGHQVDEAASATEGLRSLQQGRYDLVLTDYAMPGGTGVWMLREATRQGLMEGSVALIVTAHPEVREVTDVEVVMKPLDLDQFLEQVRRILAGAPNGDLPSPVRAPDPPARRGDRPLVELVLYVSAASPASYQARRNLEQLLKEFKDTQVKLSICDLSRDPMAGDRDRIAFTPTLVKRHPEPKMWVLGSLKDTQVVADLLRVCGVEGVG